MNARDDRCPVGGSAKERIEIQQGGMMKEGTHRKIVLALLGITLLACGKTGQPPSAEHQASNEVLAIEQTNDQEARWFNEERQ